MMSSENNVSRTQPVRVCCVSDLVVLLFRTIWYTGIHRLQYVFVQGVHLENFYVSIYKFLPPWILKRYQLKNIYHNHGKKFLRFWTKRLFFLPIPFPANSIPTFHTVFSFLVCPRYSSFLIFIFLKISRCSLSLSSTCHSIHSRNSENTSL